MTATRSCENVLGGNSRRKVWWPYCSLSLVGTAPFAKASWGLVAFQALMYTPGPREEDLHREQWGQRALFENSDIYSQKSCVHFHPPLLFSM